MPTLAIEDTSLYYQELGSGSPLLLIHGTGPGANAFDATLPLLGRKHRAIAYDRRGYSRSGNRAAPLQGYLKRQVEDAAALLRGLGAAPALVVGWSMGGIIGLALALEHPELVSRLVLWEPPLHALKHLPLRNLVAMLKAKFLSSIGLERAAVATFLRMTLAEPDGGNGFDKLDAKLRQTLLVNTKTLLHELNMGTGEELTPERLQTLRCPVSGIVGGNTLSLFGDAIERLAQLVPQLRVLRAPGLGHLGLLTHPTDFARLVLEE